MASKLLLTPEQARCNKELFQRASASAKLPPIEYEPSTAQPFIEPVSTQNTASTLAVSNGTIKSGYPPPPNSTIFSDERYHEHVMSTIFSTAMASVGYVPNSPISSPEQEAIGFSMFLSELAYYNPFMHDVKANSTDYEHNSTDCEPLLNAISGFIESVESTMGASNAQEVATEITNMLQAASADKVAKTLFSVYRINGDVIGWTFPWPVGTVFWSSVKMETHTSGKSTVQKQKLELRSYSYTIVSPLVVACADELAAAIPVPVSQFVDSINP